ncbi:MAG TPA: DHA2 family efflux MFS transporter permease subunit [Acidimicrobiia bacterium]
MTAVAPAPAPPEPIDDTIYRRRWLTLAVLCLSLLVVGIDGTIVNVALPTLVRDLQASASDLQWIVDAYTIVFASLLLMAGNTGDRLGRRSALIGGLIVFGVGSAVASQVNTAGQLIAMRSVQGVGAAFLMPATLSILTNVFREPGERARAIALWAGVSGLGVAIGPLTGGWLLEHFWWGSIFLVNVPVIAVALVGAFLVVPNSRDPHAPPLDVGGVAFSIIGLLGLLYGIIEGPARGWTDPVVLGAFAVALVFLTTFVIWESRVAHPLLDIGFFKNARFTAASLAITLVFFSMFGSLFFLSQYLQFVLDYDPLEAGLALIPVAVALMIAAPLSAKIVAWIGTKIVVTAGLLIVALGMVLMSGVGVHSGYGLIALVLVTIGLGMGLAMAPATDSIMGSLPPERAGVGSAMNDTTREIGGALGVAVLGSITASAYASTIKGNPLYPSLVQQSPQAASTVANSIGGAASVAAKLPASAAQQVLTASKLAFVDALDQTVIVGAAVAVVGAIIAAIFLPSRPEARTAALTDLDELIVGAAQRLPAAERRSVARATLGMLADAGFSSLTYNGIAARSGLATATIERNWTSKVDLVVGALEAMLIEQPVPDTGSFARDCDLFLTDLATSLSTPEAGPVIGRLIGEAAEDPDLTSALRERLIGPRREAVRTMVRRAIDRGELPTATRVDLLVDVLIGPLFHRLLITGEPVTPELGHELARTVAEHLLADGTGPPS